MFIGGFSEVSIENLYKERATSTSSIDWIKSSACQSSKPSRAIPHSTPLGISFTSFLTCLRVETVPRKAVHVSTEPRSGKKRKRRTSEERLAVPDHARLAGLLDNAVEDLASGNLDRLLATLDRDLKDHLNVGLAVDARLNVLRQERGSLVSHNLDEAVNDRRGVDRYRVRTFRGVLHD